MFRSTLTMTLVAGCFPLAAGAAPVALDLSGGFNYDAVATQAEMDALNAWYDGSQASRTLMDAFGTTGNSHDHLNQYGQHGYYHEDGNAATLQSTITTGYGTYQLGPFDTGVIDTSDPTQPMAAAGNAIRLVTGTDSSGDIHQVAVTVTLPTAQQGRYSSINALATGSDGADDDSKAWFRIYALYQDGTSALVYQSPRIQSVTRDDATADRPGGVPLGEGTVTLSPDQAAVWHEVVLSATQLVGNNYGGDPKYSGVDDDAGELRMWELNDTGGVALDPTRVLTGLTFEVDNDPSAWWVGYSRGDEVNVYAVSATPVPEPASLALLGLAGAGLVMRRRRGRVR